MFSVRTSRDCTNRKLLSEGRELDDIARQTRTWARSSDVFACFISGAKVRNPAAAQALIAKVAQAATGRAEPRSLVDRGRQPHLSSAAP